MNVHFPAPRRKWPTRLVNLAVVVVVLALMAATFVLSYPGVHEIVLQAGVSARLARIYPGLFDALFVIACAAAVVLRDARWWARCYAWLVIVLVVAVVGAADAAHAMNVALSHRDLEGVVAAAPWVLVLLAFSLMLTMVRQPRARRYAMTAPAASAEHGVRELPQLPAAAATLEAPALPPATSALEAGPGEESVRVTEAGPAAGEPPALAEAAAPEQAPPPADEPAAAEALAPEDEWPTEEGLAPQDEWPAEETLAPEAAPAAAEADLPGQAPLPGDEPIAAEAPEPEAAAFPEYGEEEPAPAPAPDGEHEPAGLASPAGSGENAATYADSGLHGSAGLPARSGFPFWDSDEENQARGQDHPPTVPNPVIDDDDAPPFATAPFATVPRLNRVRSSPTPPGDDDEEE